MKSFNYSKTVNTTTLTEEIRNSSISTSLDYINASTINNNMSVSIVFKNDLSEADISTLNTVVDNHIYSDIFNDIQKVTISDVTKTKTEKAILVATTTPEGSQVFLTSHNFCDKTTWYTKSIRKTETLVKILDKSFKASFGYWIDLEHGKVPYEDRIKNQYKEVIKKDGVQIYDYTVDYVNGEITLNSYNNEEITAEYSYSTTSDWYINPIANRILKIEGTYVTLSNDINMATNSNGIIFQLLINDLPYGLPTIYNNIDDLFECSTSTQENFVLGSFVRNRLNFEYRTSKDLDSRINAKICIKLKNEAVQLNGTRATIVAYGKSVEAI